MYDYKKIIIALDLTPMDETLITYTADLCKVISPEKIYFINIQPNLDLDEEVKSLLGNDDLPMDEFCEEKMKETVQRHFSQIEHYDTEYEVVEGSPSIEILRWTKMKEADLLIMGRKKTLKGDGITPQQVATKVKASVLLIPEGVIAFRLQHIFLPIDFSTHSEMALEEALQIQQNARWEVTITGEHMFSLPLGYEKIGKTAEEFAEALEKNAKKKARKFIDSFKGKADHVEITHILSDKDLISDNVYAHARETGADLIIIGGKGRTFATAFFMGSIVTKLIKKDSDIPLLIVKDKKRSFDFWAFLKEQ